MSLEKFTRSNRLTMSSEYTEVFKQNDYRITSGPLLLLARNNNMYHSRLGLIVGKKAVPTAVQRNRIKRIIRESFRLNKHTLSGTDIVILARKGLVSMDNRSLANLIGVLWVGLGENLKRAESSTVVQGP